jgi:hypothetical protein
MQSGGVMTTNIPNNLPLARPTYDTWSLHYEFDGIDQNGNGLVDEGTNGQDDNGDGVADEADARTYRIKVTVKNTGERAGTTLVQLYTHQRLAAISQPEKQLRGFTRLYLNPGEQTDAIITLKRDELSYWSSETIRQPAQGWIDVMTGPNAGETMATALFVQ